MTLKDAPALYKLLQDPEVTKDMGVAAFESEEQVENLINFMNDLFDNNKA